jgi:surface protein
MTLGNSLLEPLTDSNFYTAINDWFNQCTVVGDTLVESTTGSVYRTYGPMAEWDTSQVTNMSFAFYISNNSSYNDTTKGLIPIFNQNIGSWNTGLVTTMDSMFYGASMFNQDISSWDTHLVTTMNNMFNGAIAFNNNSRPLTTVDNKWNTSIVTSMNNMFLGASMFNQDISSWDTHLVITMSGMFYEASVFNNNSRPLATNGNSWNTGLVQYMNGMFYGASMFNQDISSWDTHSVITMGGMFRGASTFNNNNQPLSTVDNKWNTSIVKIMNNMFYEASMFNQDISSWDTHSVINMGGMFYGALAFTNNDRPLETVNNKWNTSIVTTMDSMFYGVSMFNQDISSWDTSSVTDMGNMFVYASAFNQNISLWNTSSVTEMSYMFYGASVFNQNISSWNLTLTPNILKMFISSAVPNMQSSNNAIYIAWSTNYGYEEADLNNAGLNTPSTLISFPLPPVIKSNICFPAGTLIRTDQGEVAIEKLQRGKHTLGQKIIKHITQTISTDKYLIRVEKGALGKNKPNRTTLMSKDHKIEFQGALVQAYRLLDYTEQVKKVKYNEEILYNILLEQHDIMSVNNLRCETLDPTSPIGCLYRGVAYKEEKVENIRFKI